MIVSKDIRYSQIANQFRKVWIQTTIPRPYSTRRVSSARGRIMNMSNDANQATRPNGIPGLRGSDHIGFTVPDIEVAHDFLIRILGATFVYKLGPYPQGPTIAEKLEISPETTMQEIRFYRLRTGVILEVFQYDALDQRRTLPQNSDVG